jgi:hypothetical protein
MKKTLTIILALCLLCSFSACTPAPSTSQSDEASPGNVISALNTPQPEESLKDSPEASVEVPSAATASASEAPSGPEIYSSYARLVSFDPSTGVAQFDYFEILRGDEAVQYLVEHEGYTQEDAQEEVDNYADGEYVEKNDNPQLRDINLTTLSLSLMYQPSGAEVTDATPVPSSYSDFLAIWTLDPTLLRDTYFYYIHVNDAGGISLVEQVFWP